MRLGNWFITNPDSAQQAVLKVPIDENIIVKGAAGSGKTNMAIYRAQMAGNNSFVIVVYTIALKKMVRFGLRELGLDKDRVVHEFSWKNRGIDISGDIFCYKGNNRYGINNDFLILKRGEKITLFISSNMYNTVLTSKTFLDYKVNPVEKPLEVSIDFDDWVDDKFYYTFYRRKRKFIEVELINFPFSPTDDNIIFVPSGFLYKEKGIIDYLIIDEGQDFSIQDYRNKFVSEAKKAVTILGDTSQQLYQDRGTSINKIAENFKFPLHHLSYNYRIPKTIARVAEKIPLPHIDLRSNNKKNNGNSDYPAFPKPMIKKCVSENKELEFILKRINMEGLDDVAVLVPNNTVLEKVHNFFSNHGVGTQVRYRIDLPENQKAGIFPMFRSVDTLDFTNQDLPCILTYHSAKGTEFENVFIPFSNDDTKIQRNSFYVAVTRSSRRVFITYSRKLTSLLKDVNPNDLNHL